MEISETTETVDYKSRRVVSAGAWVRVMGMNLQPRAFPCVVFLSHSKAINVRLIGDSELALGVNMNGCLSLLVL